MNLSYANLEVVRCFEWVCNPISHTEGKCILRLFEERVLMKVFGIKREELS
jgi:hypothetical protein